jgi:pyruvate/2-oxoglutarate dehydrogenase complex dihydrolipoamide dehydrogenase (E3) component
LSQFDYDVAVFGAGHGCSIERIRRSIHVHPTLSEMVKAAAKAAHK